MSRTIKRTLVGTLSAIGLLLVFVFQRFDYSDFFFQCNDTLVSFLVNRSIRFIINDILAITLIYSLFYERKYVLFALMVQAFGLFFLLLPYFLLKIYWPSYNGPLLNFLHRIIINPTLLILLIPAFYYQKAK